MSPSTSILLMSGVNSLTRLVLDTIPHHQSQTSRPSMVRYCSLDEYTIRAVDLIDLYLPPL
eukprot:m.11125 g.11125  ORF g.11125 m.11125 type:complete len:61 (-) comp9743_c0_seq1:380-562(-)